MRLLPIFIGILIGCDTSYSIKHESGDLKRLPEDKCVLKTLQEIPEIDKANFALKTDYLENCGRTKIHSFSYFYNRKRIQFEFCESSRGALVANHRWHSFGPALPKSEITPIREEMKRGEAKIEMRCLPNLTKALKETCSAAVDCPTPKAD